jgi:hypothetical protein
MSRWGVVKAAMDFADNLLVGEIRAYYVGVEGE